MESIEVIPSSELPGLEKALGDVETLTGQADIVHEKARVIRIDLAKPSQETRGQYEQLGALLTENTGLRKQGEAVFAPFDAIVSRVRDFLRTKKQKHTNRCEETDGWIRPQLKAWEQKEREETAAVQKVEDKAAKKQGREAGVVKAAIPSIAGYRKTRNFKAEFTDFDKLLKEFRASKDTARLKFLRQFIMGNAQKLNEFARETKDDAKVMKLLPGVHAWEE